MNPIQKIEGALKYLIYLPASMELLLRTEIFFAVLSLALTLVYYVGAWQSFLDSTLLIILKLISITALADIFLSVIVIARETLLCLAKMRKLRIFVIISSILFLIFSIFLLLISHAIIAISKGF